MTALYHGTRAGFSRGGYLFAQAFHGKPARAGHVGEDSTGYAYATLDHEMAVFYALNDRHGRGKPKVLTVVPLGPCEADPSRYDDEDEQVRCAEGFRVVAVEFIDESDYEEVSS